MKKPAGKSRREFVSLLGSVPLIPGMIRSHPDSEFTRSRPSGVVTLPCRELFQVKGTYLNAAYTHPLSIQSADAVREYVSYRLMNGGSRQGYKTEWDEVKKIYASLINADPGEVAWIPSTMAGENMVVSSLGIPGTRARIVTDNLHFDGSLYMYGELEKRGAEIKIVKAEKNSIDIRQMDSAITPGTKLVAISLVSMVNGFRHDLKTLCDIAHSRGAVVYADIIQAAGAVPVDVHGSGVDFCAGSSFKWLMGDFGAGFLYASQNSLQHIQRTNYGYRQLNSATSHFLPYETPGEHPYEFSPATGAASYFETGTLSNEAVAALGMSLRLINDIGVEKIREHRKPLLKRLQEKLPPLGYLPLTPEDSDSPIISFSYRDASTRLAPGLKDAGINIQLYENRIRISPSVYNSADDIEKLIDVLSKNE